MEPENNISNKKKKRIYPPRKRPGYVEITDSILDELHYHRERTRKGAISLLRGKRKSLPKGLNSKIIENWLMGKTKSASSVHIETVLKLWRELPDDTSIPLTLERKKNLKEAVDSSGYSIESLLRMQDDVPDFINANLIRNYLALTSRYKTIEAETYDYILKICQNAPPVPSPKKKVDTLKVFKRKPLVDRRALPEIDEKSLKRLFRYRDILGLLPSRVFKDADDIPEGLDTHKVTRWLSQKPTAKPEHVDWVLDRCEKLIELAQNIDD